LGPKISFMNWTNAASSLKHFGLRHSRNKAIPSNLQYLSFLRTLTASV